VAGEAAAQLHLLDFAGCPVAERIDEYDIVGHPPFGDLAFQMRRDRLHGHGQHQPAARPRATAALSHFGWGMPTTAASATPGQPIARFSTSIELIHSPRT
jgi:hypothetical protein